MDKKQAMRELIIQRKVFEDMILYNKDFEPRSDNSSLENRIAALEIAIQVIQRDIPKKVILKKWSPCRCPTCDIELSESLGDGYYRHPTFLERCPNVDCAQRLEW